MRKKYMLNMGIGDWGLGPIPNPHFIYFPLNFFIKLIK